MSGEALGRRLVACKGFRWMPGILTDGVRVESVDSCGVPFDYDWAYIGQGLPDTDDPATLGCVLALVREAWGPEFYVQVTAYEGGALIVVATPGGDVAHEADCSSIGQGLVEALEAAP